MLSADPPERRGSARAETARHREDPMISNGPRFTRFYRGTAIVYHDRFAGFACREISALERLARRMLVSGIPGHLALAIFMVGHRSIAEVIDNDPHHETKAAAYRRLVTAVVEHIQSELSDVRTRDVRGLEG